MRTGERIKLIRKSKGISQALVAKTLGISQAAVSQWENGVTDPSSIQIVPLADLLGVSVDELLGHPEPEQSEEDVELFELRERMRRDPSLRILFSAARNASPDHIRAAAAMLKALEPEDDQ